jgi:hypothetical protein
MGLKGYRLWVMGQLDSNVQSPTGGPRGGARLRTRASKPRGPSSMIGNRPILLSPCCWGGASPRPKHTHV